MTLQEQYNLIKEGKGAKDVFTKHAKSLFPHLVPNHYGFDNASQILTQRGIISENLWGITTGNNDNQQPDWFSIFNESLEIDTKADAKKPAKEVEEYEEKSYDSQYGAETGDDVIFDQYINGIQLETCNPKNADKTVDELKKMVLKNLKKDKLYYTKNAAFGVEGIGYTDEAPGLGKTKEVKGKYASSGMEPVKINEGIGMFMDPIGYDKGSKSQMEKARDILKDAGLPKEEIETFISNNMFKKGRLDDLAQEFIKSNLEEANMAGEYIVWIQPEGEEKREHHRAKSKSEAERIARMVYGNYYDDYNPPKIGVVSADEWSQETSLDNMNIKESSTLFRSPIELAKAVANKHGQELKQLKDQGYKVFEPAAIKYGGQTMKDSGMEMVVIKNLLYGYADEDWPSDYINELSNLLKNLNESKLRSVIRQLIKEELNLKEIDQVGEEAQKMAKSKKIDDEVNKRKKKLKALETLKELEADSVNPGKIKELYKEIKTLEKLKEKLEKKGKKKEQIIDEETYIGTGALDDLKKDPKFNSLKSDAKASAEDELKKGGSVTVENKK